MKDAGGFGPGDIPAARPLRGEVRISHAL